MPALSSVSSSLTDNGAPLYAECPEWNDVSPLAQYDHTNPIAPIFYLVEYKDMTDYFCGIMKTGEKSQHVLELTETIIRLNPAHYSAWQYHYEILLVLNAPLDVELKLMDELAVAFLKTYQVWHHQWLLLMLTRNPVPKLKFIVESLKVDMKNYHT
ncbi:hypothetical protein C0995_012717 [Termitomyces sp. Mi166|nr:hypothetical protein C0995_012717 [Termitomyces sp. Mi166\